MNVVPLSLKTLSMAALGATANDVILAVPRLASCGMLLAGLGLVGSAERGRAG